VPDTKKAPKEIPPQEWGSEESGLEIAATRPDDGGILISMDHQDTPTVCWSVSAQQARDVAATLVQRADLIDPPSRRKLGDVPETPAAIIGEFLRQGRELMRLIFDVRSDPDQRHRIAQLCDGFAIVALMAELEQVAPDRAAVVAERLADCWIDGGSVNEFIVQWFEDHAAGRPVGFNPPPTLPLTVARIE